MQMRACLLAFFLSASFLARAELVVNERGEVKGAINQLKASLLGDSFWRDQLAEARSELKSHLNADQKKQKTDTAIKELDTKSKVRQEELYKKYPKMKPSLAEQQADALREAADEIESREIEVEVEKHRNRRIATLQSIIQYIEGR